MSSDAKAVLSIATAHASVAISKLESALKCSDTNRSQELIRSAMGDLERIKHI